MSTKILPYVPQPDELTCQAACCAQAVGSRDVSAVRAELLRLGRRKSPPQSAGSPAVMGEFLLARVRSYRYSPIASINDVIEFLRKPSPSMQRMVIVHGWFTRSGHVISLRRFLQQDEVYGDGFLVDDPFKEFKFSSWDFLRGKSGDNVRYSVYGIYASCVKSQNALNAHTIYRRGELNLSEKNMWAHFIEN